ncbi:probable bifunctional TENA-E protein [Aristolochia californica]|uniref:probable bifunctional TENA-E protein n=1 Tax=Aristolochia californica TaxID=171875 RepID=UPI0035DC21CE
MKGESNEGGDSGTILTWIERHRVMYDRATRHPFILNIKEGIVDISSFERWLGQDYIFVKEFVPFLASVLLKASKDSDDTSDMEIVLGGMAALHNEISWFKKEASRWNISLLNISPQNANKDYCRFLESLTSSGVSYTVAITAYWAIEAVYQESFSLCLEEGSKTPPELLESCRRWGNNGFKEYCLSLKRIADRQLEKASKEELKKAEEAFLSVLENEVRFWNMSNGDA